MILTVFSCRRKNIVIKSPILEDLRKKDKGTIVMCACLRIQGRGNYSCIWRNKKLKQVVTAPFDDIHNMVKLTYISILLMIFNHSPTQEGNGISCRETEFDIVARIIKATHKVMCTTWVPILQSWISSKFYRTVTWVMSSWREQLSIMSHMKTIKLFLILNEMLNGTTNITLLSIKKC